MGTAVDDDNTIYIIQGRIKLRMTGLFLLFLILMVFFALVFFVTYCGVAMNDTIASYFLANTYSTVKDIMQIKQEDFHLQQREMKSMQLAITQMLDHDLINRDALLANDLSLFKRLIGSAQLFNEKHRLLNNGDANGKVMPSPDDQLRRTHWQLASVDFKEDMLPAFHE